MSRMKKWICIIAVLAIIALALFAIHYIKQSYILVLIKHELLFEVDSPDSQFRLLVYDTSGGATSPFSVGAVVESADGAFSKILFKVQFENHIEAHWIDDNNVDINGIILDVRYDTFDNTRLDWRQQRFDTYNQAALRSKKPSSIFDRIIFRMVCGKQTWV